MAEGTSIEDTVRLIFNYCNDRFKHNDYESIKKVLNNANVEELHPDIIVGILGATLSAKTQLGDSRSEFVVRTAGKLLVEFGERRTTQILKRLG